MLYVGIWYKCLSPLASKFAADFCLDFVEDSEGAGCGRDLDICWTVFTFMKVAARST